MSDTVNHPPHYTSGAAKCLDCGRTIECIDVIEHLPANIANAIKYLWRCDSKHADPDEDFLKAIWYVQRERERRKRSKPKPIDALNNLRKSFAKLAKKPKRKGKR